MDDTNNELFLSIASLWEMAIKFSIGKLKLSEPFEMLFPSQLELNSIEMLDINVDHLKCLCSLLFVHRDPFDRLLVSPICCREADCNQLGFCPGQVFGQPRVVIQ
jgi:PIN domain nuclease of toxin-antitoxin system